ncbi:murein transglycosylase [Solibacillus isronensis]|uniref:murein transglycosylase n=1 Tax=Solibacillus isronensis TaxID=412383 RepID=UPI0020CA7B38|nr:murein transglycosylase [Solibacillus isronensis]
MRIIKIVLLAILAIPAFFILILTFASFDYFYYPIIGYKAENAAEASLEEKYNEDFVIDESTYSKPLGDDFGDYHIIAHPKKNPDLEVTVSVGEDMEPLYDTYLEMHWRDELNTQFGVLYEELYGTVENYSYMVNVTFPDEIEAQYDHTDTYEEILQKEADGIGNIVFANVILESSNNINDQLGKAYEMIQHFKEQNLNYFSIEIVFFNENLQKQLTKKERKLPYNEFNFEHLDDRAARFYFSYKSEDAESVKELNQLKSPADLEQYVKDMN